MFEDLIEYITSNYFRARKIVEVGVGLRIDVAERIKEALPLAEVLATDKDPVSIRSHRTKRLRLVADDVMFPQTPVYQGASLIYSIQPPVEIIPAMIELSNRIRADLLVVPRSDEQEALDQEGWQKITMSGKPLCWKRVPSRQSS